MRIWRRLTIRLLAVSLVCGLGGLLTARLIGRTILRQALASTLVPLARYVMTTQELARCEARPETWRVRVDDGLVLFAYDARSLASRNPEAPALERALHGNLGGGPTDYALAFQPGQGVSLLLRTRSTGPCALIQGMRPPDARFAMDVVCPVVAVVIVIVLTIGLELVVIVRPLVQRIGRLRSAAERIGEEQGYASAEPVVRDEIGILSASLDRAHARIRADGERLADRQRALQRYLADVAHDLGTPIASLTLALEQGADASDPAARAELLTRALDDAVYLAGLTNNLRLASHLRDGWDPVAGDAQVDLTDTVGRVAGRASILARRRGIALEVGVPDRAMHARCNPVAAEQAIGNVVDNAVAHGNPGGHIAVILESEPGGRFALTVVDDGPGVPPAELPRLGERAFRSDQARRRDPRGSGLGLAISNEVCQRCGWELSFAAEQPTGLRVRIAGHLA